MQTRQERMGHTTESVEVRGVRAGVRVDVVRVWRVKQTKRPPFHSNPDPLHPREPAYLHDPTPEHNQPDLFREPSVPDQSRS